MARISFRRRPVHWLLVVLVAGLLTIALLYRASQKVTITLQNDTEEPWAEASMAVGKDIRRLEVHPGEGVSQSFAAPVNASELRIEVAGKNLVRWSAPYYVKPETATVTVRVSRFGEVRASNETRWTQKISKIIE